MNKNVNSGPIIDFVAAPLGIVRYFFLPPVAAFRQRCVNLRATTVLTLRAIWGTPGRLNNDDVFTLDTKSKQIRMNCSLAAVRELMRTVSSGAPICELLREDKSLPITDTYNVFTASQEQSPELSVTSEAI